jgi:hypothetical protein
MVEDRDEVEIRLAITSINVRKNPVILDPALGLGEFVPLAPFPGAEIKIIREMAVIDRDRRDVPLIVALDRKLLAPGRY